MPTHTGLPLRSIVAENVTGNIASGRLSTAVQRAGQNYREESASARLIAEGSIGSPETRSADRRGVRHFGTARRRLSPPLVARVRIAGSRIFACSTLTTSTPPKRTRPRTAAPLTLAGLFCGAGRSAICNFFAPTATASRRTKRRGRPAHSQPDIACRRIEEAWKQPRLFDEEPREKPKQESLALGDTP